MIIYEIKDREEEKWDSVGDEGQGKDDKINKL